MKNLALQLKPLFVEATHKAFPQLSEADLLEWINVEDPREEAHGDYACPIALRLAKSLQKSPAEIAEAIVAHFPKDFRVGSVEFAPPGYVNLRLSVPFLEELLKNLESGFSVEDVPHRKRPIIVEYPSTNAAKPMGAHHIITAFLGDSLANLLEFLGYSVIRINHLGDWGTHFGKLIYAVETWGDQGAIHKNPNHELGKLYVRFNQEAESNPALEDEARAIFKSLEEGDEPRLAMWQWIVNESQADLEKLLKRLGIEIDHHMGESFYLDKTAPILLEGQTKGLFTDGEGGALIFDMGPNQTPAMLQKSDGTTLYLTRDVATAKYRVETWHPDFILHVVDHAQSLHFQQDKAICQALGYLEDTKLEHISFGRMRFADSTMSTRKGNTIKLEALLDEAAKRAGQLAAERGSELPREELAALMETLGISSVKYGILSQDRNRDIIFDWDKIITLEGNSAPYLLYSYARASSILQKIDPVALSGLPTLMEESEIELLRHLCKFPQILQHAAEERKPHHIAHYLFELCQEFNRFYVKTPVLKAPNPKSLRTRIGLVHAFLHQVKTGLRILGIPVVDRM